MNTISLHWFFVTPYSPPACIQENRFFLTPLLRPSPPACIQEKGSCVHSSTWDTPILPTTSLVPSPPPQLSSLAIVSSILFVLQVMTAVVED